MIRLMIFCFYYNLTKLLDACPSVHNFGCMNFCWHPLSIFFILSPHTYCIKNHASPCPRTELNLGVHKDLWTPP